MTRDLLRDKFGYWIMRAAQSKGKVDILGLQPGLFILVQCKLNGLCPPRERKELLRLAAMNEQAIPLVAYQYKEGTRAAEVRFWQLTGPEAHERKSWAPSHVGA